MPRFLRPLLAAALALILSAAGLLVGSRLTTEPPSTPTEALAPEVVAAAPAVPIAADQLPATPEELGALASSGGDDAATVPSLIGDDGFASAAAERILDAVSAAPDPEAAAGDIIDLTLLDPATGPCAAEDSTDCATGIRSTVQPQTWAQALRIAAVGLATAGTGGSGIVGDCAATAGPTVRIVSNAPIAFELSWWPQGSPASPSLMRAQTDDASLRAWADAQRESPRALVATCVPLDGALESTRYDARVTAWVRDGVESASVPEGEAPPVSRTFSFTANGGVVPPQTQFFLVPGATDLLVASVPLREGERVEFDFWETPLGRSACGSSGVPTDRVLQLGETRVVPVARAVPPDATIDSDFTRRATALFALPEGFSVDACATTYSAGARVTWAGAVVHTADRLVPTISIHSVATELAAGKRLAIQGYLSTGEPCGLWRSEGSTERSVFTPAVTLCDFRDRYGSVGVDPASLGVAGSRGSLGQFTFTVDDNLGDAAATPRVIDLDALAPCHGACTPPLDSFQVLRWIDDDHYAYVIVSVHWTQGDSNGVLRSSVSAVTTQENDSEVYGAGGPLGQLDVENLNLMMTAYDPETRDGSAGATLISDRPGSYSARMLPAPGSGAPCARPTSSLLEEGRLGEPGADGRTAPVTVQFEGLCAGSRYALRVVLTGDDGQITTWGVPTSGPAAQLGQYAFGGPSFEVDVPPVELPIRVRWITTSSVTDATRRGFDMTLMSVSLNGTDVVGPLSGICLGGLPVGESSSSVYGVPLAERMRVTGRLSVSASCSTVRILPSDLPLTFEADISLADLIASPSGIRVQFEPPAGALRGARTLSGWVEVSILR